MKLMHKNQSRIDITGYILITIMVLAFAANKNYAAILVKSNKPESTIVITNSKNKNIKQASKILSSYIEKISGAKIKIVDSPKKINTSTTIWLGWSEELKKSLPKAHKPAAPGQVNIISKQNQIAIYGYDRVVDGHVTHKGTYNAVISFLQRDLGVRWLWPGELGEYVPQKATIKVNKQDYQYTTPILMRHFRMAHRDYYINKKGYLPKGHTYLRKHAKELDNESRQWLKYQHGGDASLHISAGHAFTRWYESYHKKHPNYFALQPDGTRDAYPHPKRVKLDISNPEVIKQWVDNAVKDLKNKPWKLAVSAAVDDSSFSGFDTSSKTEAMDPKPGQNVPMVTLRWKGLKKEHVALTTRYVRFYNKLAEKLEKHLPSDRKFYISVYAYGALRTAPIGVKLNKHIAVWFVGPIPYGNSESRNRAKDKKLWLEWGKKAAHLIWRPNMYQNQLAMPGLFPKRTEKDFRFLADNHMVGIDTDSLPNNWSTQGLQYYLLTKLAWNPYLDVKEIIEDYIQHAFGKAAAPSMNKYFNIMSKKHTQFEAATKGMTRYKAIDVFPKVYNQSWFDKLTEALNKAKTAAEKSSSTTKKQLKRIDFIATGLEFMKLNIQSIQAMNNLRYGIGGDLVNLAKKAVKATKKRDKFLDKQTGTFAIGSLWYYSMLTRKKMKRYLEPDESYIRLAKQQGDNDFKMLPMQWQFKLDPDNVGVNKHWYKENISDSIKWYTININNWWDDQLPGIDEDDPSGYEYFGAGWYRVQFKANPPKDKKAWLKFGAIDEGADVYLNGKLVAKQRYDKKVDPDVWEKPRRFNVTKVLRNGDNNLVVRVLNQAGKGGIYKPVSLHYLNPNLVTNGDFQKKLTNWQVHAGRSLSKNNINTAFDNGKFVDRKSLRVHIAADNVSNPASIRTNRIKTKLNPGKYVLRVRYKQKLSQVSSKVKTPIHVRLSPRPVKGKVNTKEYLWLRPSVASVSSNNSNWHTTSGILHVKPKRPFGSFAVTIFFYQPGTYWIDNVSLRRMK